MREAYRLAITNTTYRDDYFMMRIATRKLEQNAEDFLQEEGAFQNEYEFKNRSRRVELGKRLEAIRDQARVQKLPHEWSYENALPQPIAITGPDELPGSHSPSELEGMEISIPSQPPKQIFFIYE
jgi:hypothetical protein